MKIEGTAKSPGSLAKGERNDVAKPGTGATPAAAGTKVEMTSSSRLQEIESGLANTPAMDSQRVAEIRQAIAQGNFKIDAGKIADGLIDSVRQMLATQK